MSKKKHVSSVQAFLSAADTEKYIVHKRLLSSNCSTSSRCGRNKNILYRCADDDITDITQNSVSTVPSKVETHKDELVFANVFEDELAIALKYYRIEQFRVHERGTAAKRVCDRPDVGTNCDTVKQTGNDSKASVNCSINGNDVVVLPISSYEALIQLTKAGSSTSTSSSAVSSLPVILDFASDSNPGGGWRSNQQGTQEEALCRGSTLGLRLEEQYKSSQQYLPTAHSALYLPSIKVFHVEGVGFLPEVLETAIIAGALRNFESDDNGKFLRKKIRGILKVCAVNGRRTVILGAWGCGAFGNEADTVARAFKDVLEKEHFFVKAFDRVIFAIPDRGGGKKNFQVFEHVFGSV